MSEIEVTSEQSVFDTLNKIDVSKYVEKKGKFSYLPWADAVRMLKIVYPDSTWETHEFVDERGVSMPYMDTPCGYFVKVTVTVEGLDMTHTHPVLDYRNNPIEKPSSFDINTAIARCLTKAIALHGLGLYLYVGEDLPVEPPAKKVEKQSADQPASDKQKSEIEFTLAEKGMEVADAEKKLSEKANRAVTINFKSMTAKQAVWVSKALQAL